METSGTVANRRENLRRVMEARGLELVAYGASADFHYLTGIPVDWRSAAACEEAASATVFIPRCGDPVLVLPEALAPLAGHVAVDAVRWCADITGYAPVAGAILRDLGAAASGLAIAEGVTPAAIQALAAAAPAVRMSAVQGLTDTLRLVKEPGELEILRRVAALTGEALAATLPCIREGVTVMDIERELRYQGLQRGADEVSFPPGVIFTRSGSVPSANPFDYPREKGLEVNTSIAFDFGFLLDGYCSDFGRSFYFGPGATAFADGYRALNRSVVETAAAMADGAMRFCDVFPEIERVLDREGYGGYLRARMPEGIVGHSIGLDLHEYPWIGPDCTDLLCTGMVMAVEPKIWRAGEYYLRVEDLVRIGPDGAEFLTAFDRDRFQL